MEVQTIVLDDAGRLGMIDLVLGFLRASDDPRAPEAIVEYEQQRAVVAERMGSAASTTSAAEEATVVAQEGQAQVVGMRTLALRGN